MASSKFVLEQFYVTGQPTKQSCQGNCKKRKIKLIHKQTKNVYKSVKINVN